MSHGLENDWFLRTPNCGNNNGRFSMVMEGGYPYNGVVNGYARRNSSRLLHLRLAKHSLKTHGEVLQAPLRPR